MIQLREMILDILSSSTKTCMKWVTLNHSWCQIETTSIMTLTVKTLKDAKKKFCETSSVRRLKNTTAASSSNNMPHSSSTIDLSRGETSAKMNHLADTPGTTMSSSRPFLAIPIPIVSILVKGLGTLMLEHSIGRHHLPEANLSKWSLEFKGTQSFQTPK